jgi:hypothetical protein
MRSEHRSNGDEVNAFGRYRHLIAYLQRAGVRKEVKKRSHRKDRRRAGLEVRGMWLDEAAGLDLGATDD